MTTRNVLRGGRRAGILTAFGVATGTAIWTTASVLGLVTILRVSSTAFTAVKLAGAMYLIYLGLRSLFSAITNHGTHMPEDPMRFRGADASTGNASAWFEPYRQGLLCNVLNPKAAAIFTGVIPQFVVAGREPEMQLVEFGFVFVVLVAAWLSLYSTVAAELGTRLGARFRRAVDATTGCVLVGLGVRLATE
jgi:threonine/homoserine/homoserine lactone efflux protein